MEAELLVSCPYNPAHRIRKRKLYGHIIKCRKTYTVMNKTTCPLNITHIVDSEHIKEHIASCDSLGKLIQDESEINQISNTLPIKFTNSYLSEDWNEDSEVSSYNPMIASANRKVIRCITGLSKSQKKKFRESERMRIANLNKIDTAKPFLFSTEDIQQSLPCSSNTIFSKEKNIEHDKTVKVLDAKTYDKSANKFQKAPNKLIFDEYVNTSMISHRFDMDIPMKNHSRCVDNESLSMLDQKIETKNKIDAKHETFLFDNMMHEKSKSVGIQTTISCDQDINKFPALLKDLDDTKIESVMQNAETDKIEETEDLQWEEVFNTFNKRLMYLIDIQNIATKESIQLLEQLRNLKLSKN